MKKLFLLAALVFLFNITANSQRDTLPLGTKYREDQLYVSVLYNQLFEQPEGVSSSGFSYGMNLGFIKDIPLSRGGKWAIGIGLGYAFDYFNHGLQVTSKDPDTFSIDNVLSQNIMSLHSLELPFELRWRNSNAQRYKFWRVYPGFKLRYNIANRFRSGSNSGTIDLNGLNSVRELQYGATLSAGYDAFNLHLFYGFSSVFEDAVLNGQDINSRIVKIGIIVYIL